jgi:hypothetical protein
MKFKFEVGDLVKRSWQPKINKEAIGIVIEIQIEGKGTKNVFYKVHWFNLDQFSSHWNLALWFFSNEIKSV